MSNALQQNMAWNPPMLRFLKQRLVRLERTDVETDEIAEIERRMAARGGIWLYEITNDPIPDEMAAILEGDTPGRAYSDEHRYRAHCKRLGIKPRHNVNGKIFRRHEEWVDLMDRERVLASRAVTRSASTS